MPHAYARTGKTPISSNSHSTAKHWTDAEKRLIASESLRLMAEHPDKARIDAVRDAVKTLPKPRRRDVRDMAVVRWILPLWDEIAQEKDAMNEAAGHTPDEPESVDDSGDDALKDGKRRGPQKGAKMVRWKDDERKTIAAAFLKMQADFPDMKETEALRKAMQYSLPDNRQRKILGYSMEKPWVEPLINEIRETFERERAELAARRQAEAEAEQRQIEEEKRAAAEREYAEAQAALQRARELEQAANEAVDALSLDELMHRMADRFASLLVSKLHAGLAAVVKEAVSGVPAKDPFAGFPREVIPEADRAKPAPRDHKPRVLICGLLNQQQHEVRKEFQPLLNLEFHRGTGEGGSELGPKLQGADVVIQMAGFSGHDREDQFKKHGIKPVRINGSTSAVKRWLRQWVTGEPVRMSA